MNRVEVIEWRGLPWLPNYEISESGNLRRTVSLGWRYHAGGELKGTITPLGYHKYQLKKLGRITTVFAHRLVCEAFHGPCPADKDRVAHFDGDKLNNHYSNLRWATAEENSADRVRHEAGTYLRNTYKPAALTKPAQFRPLPSHATLRELLHYDPESGDLRRKNGSVAFTTYCHGSLVGKVCGGRYAAHRIIWKWMTGKDPVWVIDHINGDPLDNRWVNLRDVPQGQNCRNTARRCTNSSGHVGVNYSRRDKRWCAVITVSYRSLSLGSFKTKEQAAAARRAGEIKYGFHPNHGRERNV